MRSLIIILCLILSSCYSSRIPRDIENVFHKVNSEITYGTPDHKWVVPENGVGDCTNYTVYYIKELHKLGYDARMFFPHVAVKVETDSGTYVLDSARQFVYKLEL